MKKIKFTTVSLLIILGLFLGFRSVSAGESHATASEEETSASAKSEAESTCETGPYGQCVTTAKAEAEVATSKIVYVDEREKVRGVMTHEPVDASIDGKTAAVAMGSVSSGLIAFAIKIKQHFA